MYLGVFLTGTNCWELPSVTAANFSPSFGGGVGSKLLERHGLEERLWSV